MIYYFSGTGNSQWAARQLARHLNTTALRITEDLTVGRDDDAVIGIVCPVYAWGAPPMVERFARELDYNRDAFTFILMTCGKDAGRATEKLAKHFPADSRYTLIMPENYVALFKTDSPDVEARKLDAAEEELKTITEEIKSRKAVTRVHPGVFATAKTKLINPFFHRFASRTHNFTVSDACISCEICYDICPSNAIEMREGRPVWVKDHCAICLGCLHRCKANAIEKGRNTAKNGRYYYGHNARKKKVSAIKQRRLERIAKNKQNKD